MKQFLSLMLCLCMVLTLQPVTALAAGEGTAVQADRPVFTDIAETDGTYPYARYLASQGIMEGFSNGTFCPEAALTRAQAAKIAVLAKGLKPVAKDIPSFNDVPAGYWAYAYIETAAAAGLFKGYPGGSFRPDEPITRAAAAELLIRLSGGGFSDDSLAIADIAAGNWAYQPAVTAVEASLMGLSSEGYFVPGAAFTRGELAQSLSALLAMGPALCKAELVGTLTVKSGTVEITGQDGNTQLFTKGQETAVTVGMSVTTKTSSRAEISYDDGSGIRMEPETQISIVKSDGFHYMRSDGTPAVAVDQLEMKLNEGRIFGALANRNEGSDVNVVTSAAIGTSEWWLYPYSPRERIRIEDPSGVTGVWGSFWSNLVTPGDGSETDLLIGDVVVSSGGQTVILGPGQSTSVPPSPVSPGVPPAPPAPPASMTPGQAQQFGSASDWVLQQAQQIQTNAPTPPPTPPAPQPPGQLPAAQPPSTPPVTPQPPAITPPSPQQPGQPPVNVVNVIQTALNNTGSAVPSSGGGSGGSSHSGNTLTLPAKTFPDALQGGEYGEELTASGGAEPYTFAMTAGALPTGVEFHPDGNTAYINGTTAADAVDATFTVTVTDSRGKTATRQYTIAVYPMISVQYTPNGESADPAGVLTAEGGAGGDYTFALSEDDPGELSSYELTLNADGRITETVTESGSVNVNVIVTDGHGNSVILPVTVTFTPLIP